MSIAIAFAIVGLIILAIQLPVEINRQKEAQEPGYGSNYEGIGG